MDAILTLAARERELGEYKVHVHTQCPALLPCSRASSHVCFCVPLVPWSPSSILLRVYVRDCIVFVYVHVLLYFVYHV